MNKGMTAIMRDSGFTPNAFTDASLSKFYRPFAAESGYNDKL